MSHGTVLGVLRCGRQAKIASSVIAADAIDMIDQFGAINICKQSVKFEETIFPAPASNITVIINRPRISLYQRKICLVENERATIRQDTFHDIAFFDKGLATSAGSGMTAS